MRGILLRTVGALAALLVASGVSQASAIITVVETGGNVIVSGAGTLNLTSLTFSNDREGAGGFINASLGLVRTGNRGDPFGPTPETWDDYVGITGPTSFGLGGPEGSSNGNGTGDIFGVYGGNTVPLLVVPDGYVSGSALSGGMTYFGETIAALGMMPGAYVWTLPNDTLTLNVGVVPIPAAVWLFGSALGLLGWMRRKAT